MIIILFTVQISIIFLPQGVVAFSSQGDRIALTQIEQMIDGQYRKLGYYDTQADNLTWLNMEKWSGDKVRNLYYVITIFLFFYFEYIYRH